MGDNESANLLFVSFCACLLTQDLVRREMNPMQFPACRAAIASVTP